MIRNIVLITLALSVAAVDARAEDVVVYQQGKAFSEDEVTVKIGQGVIFTNKDPITHNVFSSTPNMSFDLKTQKPGESTTVTFDHAGDSEVQCAIHPQMTMKVHVQ